MRLVHDVVGDVSHKAGSVSCWNVYHHRLTRLPALSTPYKLFFLETMETPFWSKEIGCFTILPQCGLALLNEPAFAGYASRCLSRCREELAEEYWLRSELHLRVDTLNLDSSEAVRSGFLVFCYGLSVDHTRSAESIEDDDPNLSIWLVGLWTLISFPK